MSLTDTVKVYFLGKKPNQTTSDMFITQGNVCIELSHYDQIHLYKQLRDKFEKLDNWFDGSGDRRKIREEGKIYTDANGAEWVMVS